MDASRSSSHGKFDIFPGDMSGVIADLHHLSCCPRCVLRLCGEKDIEIYRKPIKELEKNIASIVGEATNTENSTVNAPVQTMDNHNGSSQPVCPSCLGLLTLCTDENFLEKCRADVEEEDFQFSKYSLSVSVPLQLLIREHSILLHLRQKHSQLDVFKAVTSEDIFQVKDIFKWIFSQMLAEVLEVAFVPLCPFEVSLSFTHEETDAECGTLIKTDSCKEKGTSRPRKKRKLVKRNAITKPAVTEALSKLSNYETFKREFTKCPLTSPSRAADCSVTCQHSPIYVAGRYNKYSRELSQTPWILEGERKGVTSVEELICEKIKLKVIAKGYNFSSSGREDIDVCTLGKGRPFVVEFTNPHRVKLSSSEMKQLQEDINGSTKIVAVRDLQMINKSEIAKLKEGETEKTKSYSALISIDKAIEPEDLQFLTDVKNLVLKQSTPIRVLHRRPLAVRDKVIHTMSADFINPHHFRLYLCTQAGTYIKEFVHGDFGRTKPNLCTLMNANTDILELDVTAVNLDWPKQIDD
ncbi:tRNA pseudouridine synthase Pus10-like [Ptychodera flava]|uniref:tRNA pseudouridine synthase Pus10-like n=1 Tax=Ptychodera flava TaxID=63121 RepID=UPI003969D237